jgi:two-component system sensor histidine kinase KdpD
VSAVVDFELFAGDKLLKETRPNAPGSPGEMLDPHLQHARQPERQPMTPEESGRMAAFVQAAARLDLHTKPGPQLASLIQSTFEVEAVAIFDADLNETYEAGEWFGDPEQSVRNVCVFETVRDDPETGLIRRVLRVREMPIGALQLRGELSASTSSTVATLIAITFDRYHSLANEMRMESAQKTEQLRTTVLDSLAHAYKTPLTAIRAASSGLAEMGNLSPAQRGLVALIEEQTELLNQLTTRLLKTARVDAHALNVERVAIAPAIDDVVAAVRAQLGGVQVKVSVARENLSILCDPSLLQAMLMQFVDNAAKYADEGTTVTITATEQSSAVVLSVHNCGPAIPAADRERVFDRYFRSSGTAGRASGTGIGLSVARQAALAHGGDVWVTSDPRRGTTFFASLPAAPPGVQA